MIYKLLGYRCLGLVPILVPVLLVVLVLRLLLVPVLVQARTLQLLLVLAQAVRLEQSEHLLVIQPLPSPFPLSLRRGVFRRFRGFRFRLV